MSLKAISKVLSLCLGQRLGILLLAACLTLTVACDRPVGSANSSYRFLLPWADTKGQFQLEEVSVTSLESPYLMRGSLAKVFVEAGIGQNGFRGKEAQVRLARSGALFIPRDPLSSLSVTTYAQMERIFLLDKSLGWDKNLSWPRSVGISIHTVQKSGLRETNNARYFSGVDVILINPYTLADIPLAINPGVLAHEHFHAHFETLVLGPLRAHFAEALDADFDETNILSLILRSWNEGLADFYGHVFSGDPEFMSRSLNRPDVQFRALNQRPLQFLSPETFRDQSLKLIRENQSPVYLSYLEGSKLARFFYALLEQHEAYKGELGRNKLFQELDLALRALPELIKTRMLEAKLQSADFLEVFYQNKKSISDPFECELLSQLVGKGHRLPLNLGCK